MTFTRRELGNDKRAERGSFKLDGKKLPTVSGSLVWRRSSPPLLPSGLNGCSEGLRSRTPIANPPRQAGMESDQSVVRYRTRTSM